MEIGSRGAGLKPYIGAMILLRHGQSEFNAVYSVTRVDPGIPDPTLTELGRAQAREAAAKLADQGLIRIIASPYIRTLETARIAAETLRLPIVIEPLVRERAAFHCDIGTRVGPLKARYPEFDFDHLDDPWWHDHVALGVDESEAALNARADRFRRAHAADPDWDRILVVTHWGFVRALTGQTVANCVPVRLARPLPL